LKKYNNKIVVIPNSKYNRYLKEVAELLRIDKNLTTHVGRKTFGFIYLNLGLDYETVAAMLGHKSIRTTERMYAKVLTNRIAKKLQDIDISKFVSQNQYETLLITKKS
jgi:site-specific recombinase XerD